MSLDYKKMMNDIDEFCESPEGVTYFNNIKKIEIIQKGRYTRFEKYLESHDFDKLMLRLIYEHGHEWREKCWHNGYEVYSNNKLQFLLNYISDNLEPIEVSELETMFNQNIWFFKGYYFRTAHGQGTITDIFNGKDKKHLLQI